MKKHTIVLEITTADEDEYKREYPTWFVAGSLMESLIPRLQDEDFYDLNWKIKLVSPTQEAMDIEMYPKDYLNRCLLKGD